MATRKPKKHVVEIGFEMEALDSGHPVEVPADYGRALEHIAKHLRQGTMAGIHEFDVPHTHTGEPDNARYRITWRIEQ